MNKQKKMNEIKILKDLVANLIKDYEGALCFLSNKSLELGSDEYKIWIKEFLSIKIEELDLYWDKLITEESEQPIGFYLKMLNEFKGDIKNG